MNLDNLDMVKLREAIFDQYRGCREELMALANEDKILNQQIYDLHQKMHDKHQEQSMLRSLIDIMLEEDCDPVTAKLKFNERLEARNSEEKIAVSSTYGYGYADRRTSDVLMPFDH